ncbi:MAG TPA: condensation domain-containing protein, partial [Pyrinomonadaceae bacterium]
MNDSQTRPGSLTAERLKLLRRLLEAEGLEPAAQPAIPPRTTQDAPPLSFAQQRLWFTDQLAPGNPAYNETIALHLSGLLNRGALEQSLNEIVRRHEVLRTTYIVVGDQPAQKINPALPLELTVVELHGILEHERDALLHKVAVEQTHLPFVLSEWPLLRAKLLQWEAEEHVLLITMHHICTDGWSMGVFYRELAALYEAYSGGEGTPLEELP